MPSIFNHDDDDNDHAQIHSCRIESCAQAAGNPLVAGNTHNLFGLSFSLSLLPRGWTRGYVGEATESHIHEVSCVERVVATVLPQQFQQQPHAPDHWMQPIIIVWLTLLLCINYYSSRNCAWFVFFFKKELTKTKKNTRTLCNWALRIKCTSIFLYVFFYRENFGLQKLKMWTVCWHYMCT